MGVSSLSHSRSVTESPLREWMEEIKLISRIGQIRQMGGSRAESILLKGLPKLC